MNNDLVVTMVLAFIIGGITFFAGHTVGKQDQLNSMQETYKTCLLAQAENDSESEQACGDAQDKTSTEFNCNGSGKCWVEVK